MEITNEYNIKSKRKIRVNRKPENSTTKNNEAHMKINKNKKTERRNI